MPTRVRLVLSTTCRQGDEENSVFYAARLLEEAINSQRFRDFIINFDSFASCDQTNAAILDRLLSGATTLQPSRDQTILLYLAFYSGRRGVVGYTYENTLWQYANRRCLPTHEPWSLAGNLAHEYCHKAGYIHSYHKSDEWPRTVPYAVGNWIQEECRLIAANDPIGLTHARDRFGVAHLAQWVSPELESRVDEQQIAANEPNEDAPNVWSPLL